MITAESIYLSAKIDPVDFGKEVVPVSTPKEQQRALAVAYIDTHILPGAIAEVIVPVLKASGGNPLPFSDSVLERKYPGYPRQFRETINDSLQKMADEAIKSYARAEINLQTNSNAKEYDEDAQTGREVADEKLQKLLDSIADIIEGPPVGLDPSAIGDYNGRPRSMSLATQFTF